MYEDVEKVTNLPNAGRVVESLRDTGYNFNMAVADVIDNSIAADATEIHVDLEEAPGTGDQELLLKISDNGCGMDRSGLINALKYGSDKRSSIHSLGKFGMGLKTASTAICRKVSVVSRAKNSKSIHKAILDLDYMAGTNGWEILLPDPDEDDIDDIEDINSGGSGTVVTWTKIDRLLNKKYKQERARQEALNKICAGLSFHLSATFGRFLDTNYEKARNIVIIFNGEKLEPWDPFCLSEPNTIEVTAETPLQILDQNNNEIASAALHAYVIPRNDMYSSVEAVKKAKGTFFWNGNQLGGIKDGLNGLQGFYVYRENRLIVMGDWLGIFVKEPHMSLSRIEFSFDSRLDSSFRIDIKKSKIILDLDILDQLATNFLPGPRKAAMDVYRNKVKKDISLKSNSIHTDSNRIIDSKASEAGVVDVVSLDKKNNTVTVTNLDPQPVVHKIVILKTTNPQMKRVIPVDNLDDGVLWEPTVTSDSSVAVYLNRSHDFYKKIYYPNRNNHDLILGLDALIWSLANSEFQTSDEESKNRYRDMRFKVSFAVRKYIDGIPEPGIDYDDEEN